MGTIAVVLFHNNGKLYKATLSALTAARQLSKHASYGAGLVGMAFGPGAARAAAEAGAYGFSKILYSEHASLMHPLAMPAAAAMLAGVKELGASTIVAASTSVGKDVLPRVAAALDAGQASDIVAVNGDGSVRRPMYAGDVLADVTIESAVKVVTVRASAFAAAETEGGAGVVAELAGDFTVANGGEFVSYDTAAAERPELGDAEIVVSGGRALGSAENFKKVMYPLADSLGAAIGASRAAVDSGYAPNDWQVGQTGKIVAPQLYVAVGVSGAIQHLAGMKDSKVIVAINKDPDAPIFEVADYGLVADLFDAVPRMTEAVKKLRGA